MYLISSKCPIVRYLALVQEDVYVNVEVIESFATAETMAANRVYGDLHRDFGPSRDPSSTHYVPSYMWPWPRFPPFLGPNFLLFSSDTIPRLLHSLPLVPPFSLWEVWLSGLVGIQAEVLRIGVKDFFAPVWKKVSARSCDVFVHGRLFLETRLFFAGGFLLLVPLRSHHRGEKCFRGKTSRVKTSRRKSRKLQQN